MTTPAPLSVFAPAVFRGRVYGVTGGAHGIGEATVKALCSLGASVVLIDTHEEHLARVEAEFRDSPRPESHPAFGRASGRDGPGA